MPYKDAISLPIAAAEQETGISKDVLRVWERRYGFPAPLRDAQGDRLYPADQIRRLRLLRMLLDLGQRPGKLILYDESQLATLIAKIRAEDCHSASTKADAGLISRCIAMVAGDAPTELEGCLSAEILRLGLERFASEVAAPLCVETGVAWERGEIGVYQEHMFSQILARCLRQSIDRLAKAAPESDGHGHPKVLLTTVPGEIHELGLLMVEAVLTANGVVCRNLGPQTPMGDVIEAAQKYGCAIVALSFSSWFDQRRAITALEELRTMLPPAIEIWAGGANAALRRPMPQGIRVLNKLEQIPLVIAAVRKASS